jgi:hypothetical protein
MIGNIVAGTFSAGAPPIPPTSYESIATVTVGSGGTGSDITFTSIPSTYKHLQIRGIGRRTDAQDYFDSVRFYFNTDTTTTNYYRHFLGAENNTAFAGSTNNMPAVTLPGNSQTANAFGGFVVDILDYSDTNKFKTVRTLGGLEMNTTLSEMRFQSGLWRNTAAINQITFIANTGFTQYSQFALYGIRD